MLVPFLFSGGAIRNLLIPVALFLSAACAPHGHLRSSVDRLSEADRLFRSAEFAEARNCYLAALRADGGNVQGYLRLGEIALLHNQVREAEHWLLQASAMVGAGNRVNGLLAEVYYRLRAFDHSARHLRIAGSDVTARKLEHLAADAPYLVEGPRETRIRFVSTDPLPVVGVRVNDGVEVNFLIDTGAPEVILDPEFAKDLAVTEFGSVPGRFAGDQRAEVIQAAVESIAIGEMRVRHTPVHLLSTRRFSRLFGGMRIDGILGTRFLYQFISTIDYPKGEITLRQASLSASGDPDPEAAAMAIPLFLAGDHYLLARGSVNGYPMLFFVDTGIAGLGFAAPTSTLDDAGIAVQPEQRIAAVGGGGALSATVFSVGKLALGDAVGDNVLGAAGIFPPSLEHKFGFRIGGLISHAFFRPYALTFDFTRMRLYVRPSRPEMLAESVF